MKDLKKLTDEDLAALFREKTAEARQARVELHVRGYKGQWMNESRGQISWRDYTTPATAPDKKRFIKNIEIEEMKLVKTTVRKEI